MTKKSGELTAELSNGDVVNIDIYAITWREYITMPRLAGEDMVAYSAMLAKVIGWPVEKFLDLPAVDARMLDQKISAALRNPLGENPT
jgi:hypothetical protein